MRLTVAICTWNRSTSLRRTLETLEVLRVPPGVVWELLLVDNGSTDGTPRVAREFAGRIPLRYVREPDLGLSNARNRAVGEASGDYILWTDDDVSVDPGWLSAYTAAFRRFPDAALFGGPIRPRFEAPPPEWLRRAWPVFAGCYAERECGRGGGPIRSDYLPFGANMALRMDVQSAHRYDPTLGRTGDDAGAWEESAVLRTILARGGTGRWVPGAMVFHRLPPERLTRDHLRRQLERHGEVGARFVDGEDWVHVLGRPAWVWLKVLIAPLAYRLHRCISPPEVWARHMKAMSFYRGFLRGYRREGSRVSARPGRMPATSSRPRNSRP